MFAFKAVDSSCNPMPGLKVELWHTNCEGFYSADEDSADYIGPSWNVGDICVGNNTTRRSEAESSMWHRGSQTTDADGVVYFKSCFPGWYKGRTTHIHIKFSDGNLEFHTQLTWTDAICREIQVGHPEYIGVEQNCTLADGCDEGVFGGGPGPDPEFGTNTGDENILNAERLEDGSMLSAKIIAVT